MTVNQISVFLENKPGELAEFTKILQKNEIDMRALSLAETGEFGIARLITDDPLRTAQVLKDAGYVCSLTPVLAVEIEDRPGALVQIVDALGQHQINLEYTYAFLAKKANSAFMVFRVADNDEASKVLTQNGVRPLSQDDLHELFA